MKISKTSLNLLILAWLFVVFAVYFGQTSNQIRIIEDEKYELQKKERRYKELSGEKTGEKKPSFGFSHSSDDDDSPNYAGYLAICFFILTASTVVAAIWLWKRE